LKSFITADVNDTIAAVNRLKNCREMAEKHIHSLEKGHLPGEEAKKIPQPELINRLLDTRIVSHTNQKLIRKKNKTIKQ